MKVDRILKHFEQVAEAPHAVPRLRRFILDLAVRGKLVEQDPADEPAAELLKRIQQEKRRLIQAGEYRKEKPPPNSEDEPLFPIPPNWQWSRLAEVGFINPRNTADDGAQASFVPMALISADYGIPSRHDVRPWGEIRSGYTHFAEGDIALAKITPCFENGKSTVFRGLTGGIGAGTTELHVLRPVVINPDYTLLFLKCPHFIESGIPRMTGTAGQKRVPPEYFACAPFPLPPLSEQHRIVAKVDELMALCDELEAAQAKRERRRDRLVAATLHGLNNGDGSAEPGTRPTFEDSARFYFNHLPLLTTRPEHIHQLRQTILNLAVRGKLVPEVGRDQSLAPKVCDAPFHLPVSWQWKAVADLGDTQTGSTPPTAERKHYGGSIPFIKPAAINDSVINYEGQGLTESGARESTHVEAGAILMVCIGGSIGKAAIVDRPVCFNQQINSVSPTEEAHPRFVLLAMRSPYFQERVLDTAAKGTLPIISKGKWERLSIPLPPLAEQHRIVAKVDELMALCDELEACLTATATARRQLLEATLHRALEGES